MVVRTDRYFELTAPFDVPLALDYCCTSVMTAPVIVFGLPSCWSPPGGKYDWTLTWAL